MKIKITDLHKAIMNRDDCSLEEADQIVCNMIQMVIEGADPEEVLWEEGFEPDYFFDIIP